ncbi:hypothetical protein T440DRAFT_505976 [Plenodomus tracheiphilus IPT5]|uniref:Peptidase domain-containing protein n=1 Tax=Plenodomus tracheiphilus IPT5 TaxID=1408161 RepID=A0A6A7BC25_9PLEO|nr:hypothetical protein T440DRAFT_505976 [Plenodomus tracheiphilus IPT5]
MVGFSKYLLTAAAVLTVAHAHPQGGPQSRSPNPAWLVKRELYDLNDITDTGRKDKLTQGLKDAVTIAAKALEKMNDDTHKPKLEYWFGDQHSNDEARTKVQGVLKNFVGDNTDGTGAPTVGKVTVYNGDYWKPTAKEIPGVGDGTTGFCSLEKDGKTGAAYFKRDDNKKPAMHYCDKVFDRTDLATLTADGCSKLGEHISTAVWTKNFIGANVLHEFMHYPRVGKDSVGSQITDYAYDAFQCHALAVDEKEERRALTLTNADTYVWFVLDIAFAEICGKSFSGPRDERDDDATNQDWPDSDPETDDPTNGACDCNESGCTPDSAACCANNTCTV